jgi:hypothetical protein
LPKIAFDRVCLFLDLQFATLLYHAPIVPSLPNGQNRAARTAKNIFASQLLNLSRPTDQFPEPNDFLVEIRPRALLRSTGAVSRMFFDNSDRVLSPQLIRHGPAAWPAFGEAVALLLRAHSIAEP